MLQFTLSQGSNVLWKGWSKLSDRFKISTEAMNLMEGYQKEL